MRILRRSCYGFLLLCLLPCTSWAQAQKLYFNPATAGAAVQSKFIEIINFIPVDAGSQKINAYSLLFVTQKYWVIYDYNENKLTFLNKEGKFVKTIDVKKYGNASIEYDNKNELLKFSMKNKHYTLIEKDLVDIRANYEKKSNQKYFKNYVIDLKEENIHIKRTPTDPYFIINAQWYYDDYYYISNLTSPSKLKDTIGYELQILQNYKPVQSFFSYNKNTDKLFKYAGLEVSLSKTDTPYVKYTSRLFNSTIYRLDKDSMHAMYEIILPAENAFPASLLKNGFKSKADWTMYRSRNAAIFQSLYDIINLKNYLFFSIEYMRNSKMFLYDKKTAKFYNTEKIKGDSTQFNLHLLQNGLGQYKDGMYYKMVPAQSLVDFYNKNKEKNIIYPPVLEMFLKTATKTANPVIVAYKLND